MPDEDLMVRLLAEGLKNAVSEQEETLRAVKTRLSLQERVNKTRELDAVLSGILAAVSLYKLDRSLYRAAIEA